MKDQVKLNILPSADSKAKAAAETTRAAESLRKLLLAMANDFRVMVIKLADRLHNMRTLNALPDFKQTRIANETRKSMHRLLHGLGFGRSVATRRSFLCHPSPSRI
ncbi:MAG: HD domain-containing protein [Fimbriimonadaceae bacterium]